MNALVTGGSRGIGKAICVKLAEMGMHVIINYRNNKQAAEETLSEVNKISSGELLPFDVADKNAISDAISQWKEKNKGQHVSILVNNAGIRKDQLMMWMKDEEWEDVINTNLSSFFYLTRNLLQDMLVNKFGRIVNIVSLSGQSGLPGQVNYSAAKAGVIGATKALAQEVGKKNVTVNAISPGFVRTSMTEELEEKELKKNIPVNRFGDPEEIAEIVGFIASEKSGYITGEVISVNGGLYT